MIRITLASLVALALAATVAWQLGGTLGSGVLAGFLLGAGFTGLGVMYQRHVAIWRPEKIFHAFTVSFLAKLVALLIGALAFRYVDAAALRVDWRSFVIAFAGAVALILPLGAADLRAMLRRRAPSPPLTAKGEAGH